MRHVVHIRNELGLRTIFNLLGPLANPAGAKRQLLGVYASQWLRPLAEVLRTLGCEKAWLVHGRDGMDEISVCAATDVVELYQGEIREFTITPESLGFERAEISDLLGGTAQDNALALQQLLSGKLGAYRNCVILNTGAALMVADHVASLQEGCALAASAIDSGKARETLDAFILSTTEAA